MPQLFDIANLDLDSAAELVAVRARLGVGTFEKQALSPGMAALIGGGGGLGIGLISTLMSKRKKKKWLRNALLGTALGAGVGAGGNWLMQNAGGLGGNTIGDTSDELTAARGGGAKPTQARESILGRLFGGGDDRGSTPEIRAIEKKLFDQGGQGAVDEYYKMNPGGGGGGAIAGEYLSNPVNKVEDVLIGGGAGHLYDVASQKVRQRMANSKLKNAPVTAQEMINHATANPKTVGPALGDPAIKGQPSLLDKIRQATGSQQKQPHALHTPEIKSRPILRTPHIQPMGIPGTRPASKPILSNPDGTQLPLTTHQIKVLQNQVRSGRPTKAEPVKRGRRGKAIGGIAGGLLPLGEMLLPTGRPANAPTGQNN